MTGHHHEPFDDAIPSAGTPAKEDRSHLHLWIAVGVTMAVIVAFWLVLLPSQFGKGGTISTEAERLKALQAEGYQASMRASLEGIRSQLDATSRSMEEQVAKDAPKEEAPAADAAYDEEIQQLQEKIEGQPQR